MLLQATAVAIKGRAVLIMGEPGTGKSSLALGLIDRGARLIGDDGVVLSIAGGALIASPPPNIEGLLEVRSVGFLRYETTTAPAGLLIAVGRSGDRLPGALPVTKFLGVDIPTLGLEKTDWTSPMRAEQALLMHGRT